MRAAAAGDVAAGVWAAAEPGLRRLSGRRTPTSACSGAPLSRRHGASRAPPSTSRTAPRPESRCRNRGPGWRSGIAAAQLEGAALWPAKAAVDRFHPDRRAARGHRCSGIGRIFWQEVAAHAIFGGVLGALLRAEHRAAGRGRARRDEHGVDGVDDSVRRLQVGDDHARAAVEDELAALERKRDLLALDRFHRRLLLRRGDGCPARHLLRKHVVREHLLQQRLVGGDRGVRRRRGLLQLPRRRRSSVRTR